MSVVFAQEVLSPTLCEDMAGIIGRYYTWSLPRGLNKGIPPYNFDWSVYHKAEQAGLLLCTTAREADVLVGFTLYMVLKAPHHDDVIMAECDSIFVDVDHQGKSIGKQLLVFTVDKLQQLGVKWVTNRYRTRTQASPMFEQAGFKVWEVVYMKELN